MYVRTSAGVAALLAVAVLLPAAAAAQTGSCTGTLSLMTDGDTAAHEWVSSDPRLSGTVTIGEGWSFYPEASEVAGEVVPLVPYELVNAGGSWRCIASVAAGPEPDLDGHQLLFAGDGAYEGLTAYINVDWGADGHAFTGFIADTEMAEDPALAG